MACSCRRLTGKCADACEELACREHDLTERLTHKSLEFKRLLVKFKVYVIHQVLIPGEISVPSLFLSPFLWASISLYCCSLFSKILWLYKSSCKITNTQHNTWSRLYPTLLQYGELYYRSQLEQLGLCVKNHILLICAINYILPNKFFHCSFF